MKKISPLTFLAFAFFAIVSCKSAYEKANDDLDFLKRSLNTLDSLNLQPSSAGRDSAVQYHLLLVQAFKDEFQKNIVNISDHDKQLELIKKFDRVYVMRIEQ